MAASCYSVSVRRECVAKSGPSEKLPLVQSPLPSPQGGVVTSIAMAEVTITTRGAKRIRKGHLWVYRSDVRDAQDVAGGAIVSVVDEARNFVGVAFYSDQSEIALRFLSTRRETIDRDWWRDRLRQCAERRSAIAKETNAYRLVYSEGDLLPSLIVDVYDGHYVLQALSQGTDRLQNEIVELMIEEFKPRSITERNDARVRQFEGLELRKGVLYGDAPDEITTGSSDPLSSSRGTHALLSFNGSDEIEINQNAVRFIVSPLSGQKTGAF